MNTNTYVLIGAGGTGSILAPQLHRHLFNTHGHDFLLLIVDADMVEEHNLTRQGFVKTDLGRSKAECLAEQLGGINANVVHEPSFFNEENAARLVREGDTVLVAVDNYRARADLERHAMTLRDVAIINGGNEASTSSCQIFLRAAGENLTPPLSYMHSEILADEEPRDGVNCMVRAADADSEQTIAANMLSAAWMLAALAHIQRVAIDTAAARTIALDLRRELPPEPASPTWHEIHTDLRTGKAGGPDWREGNDDWRTYQPTPAS